MPMSRSARHFLWAFSFEPIPHVPTCPAAPQRPRTPPPDPSPSSSFLLAPRQPRPRTICLGPPPSPVGHLLEPAYPFDVCQVGNSATRSKPPPLACELQCLVHFSPRRHARVASMHRLFKPCPSPLKFTSLLLYLLAPHPASRLSSNTSPALSLAGAPPSAFAQIRACRSSILPHSSTRETPSHGGALLHLASFSHPPYRPTHHHPSPVAALTEGTLQPDLSWVRVTPGWVWLDALSMSVCWQARTVAGAAGNHCREPILPRLSMHAGGRK